MFLLRTHPLALLFSCIFCFFFANCIIIAFLVSLPFHLTFLKYYYCDRPIRKSGEIKKKKLKEILHTACVNVVGGEIKTLMIKRRCDINKNNIDKWVVMVGNGNQQKGTSKNKLLNWQFYNKDMCLLANGRWCVRRRKGSSE